MTPLSAQFDIIYSTPVFRLVWEADQSGVKDDGEKMNWGWLAIFDIQHRNIAMPLFHSEDCVPPFLFSFGLTSLPGGDGDGRGDIKREFKKDINSTLGCCTV